MKSERTENVWMKKNRKIKEIKYFDIFFIFNLHYKSKIIRLK